jgi:hypothetical protein
MKPTRTLLGKLGAPLRELSTKLGSAGDAVAKDAAGPQEDVKKAAAKAKPQSSKEVLVRVQELAKVLKEMTAPPEVGVRAKGKDNLPSKEAWNAARDRAVKRLDEVVQRLKGEIEAARKSTASAPAGQASAGLVEATFKSELDRMTSALDATQPPKKER